MSYRGVHDDAQAWEVVCGLAGSSGQAASESLRHERGGGNLPGAAGEQTPKSKTTEHGQIEQYLALPSYQTVARYLLREELTPAGIARCLAGWKANFKINTRYNYARAARKILRQIGRHDLAELIPKQQKPQARTTIATLEQVATLYQIATPEMRLLIMLGAGLGLRWEEILSATPEKWNAQTNELRVVVKGGQERTFKVPPSISQALNYACEGGEGTFIQRLAGGTLRSQAIRNHWKKLTKKAGVPWLNPHDLRRTAAVNLYRETKDVFAVKALLGHENLQNTAWYLKPHEEQAMRELQNKLFVWTPKGERVQ